MSKPTARQRRLAALRVLAATGEYGLPPAQFAENIPVYPAATIRGLFVNGLVERNVRLRVTPKGRQLLADIDRQQEKAAP